MYSMRARDTFTYVTQPHEEQWYHFDKGQDVSCQDYTTLLTLMFSKLSCNSDIHIVSTKYIEHTVIFEHVLVEGVNMHKMNT